MPTRYVCKDCIEVSDSRFKKECATCGRRLEEVKISTDLESIVPYILAGIAAFLLLTSHLFDLTILTWFTFPLIGAGVIYDHIYQKQVTESIKKVVKEEKSNL